jgi:hypothetical protein
MVFLLRTGPANPGSALLRLVMQAIIHHRMVVWAELLVMAINAYTDRSTIMVDLKVSCLLSILYVKKAVPFHDWCDSTSALDEPL